MTPLRTAVLPPNALSSPFFLSFVSILLSVLSHNNALVAAQDGATITLSFLNAEGTVVGQPQSISYATCTTLIVPQPINPGEVSYTTVRATDLRAGLNLYAGSYCQLNQGSTVGQWKNEGYAANILAVRWEGTADAIYPTGVYRPDDFPHRMNVQQKITPNRFTLDPSKGKILVGLVSVVLAIGVITGIYQVYKASLYVAPPKKPKKEKKSNGLNIKKVKKKDAYYRKPIREDQQSFQRLESTDLNSPELPLIPQVQAQTQPSQSQLQPSQSQSQMVERRGFRNNHVSDTGSPVAGWNSRLRNNNESDSVLINMQGTSAAATGGGGSTWATTMNNRENSGFGGSSISSSSRGTGEVVVPMHYVGNNNNNNNNSNTYRQPQRQ
ncbi:hypothetical protein BGZ76_007785 [Entomortierella beljakovae]|nr:hypothetical protein BGZ76_007785 [Entomortierella beljakovae]